MIHFAVALGLLLHVLFWGVGGAMLAMPLRWRRFWPVLVVPAGLALQSAVVWAGAYADLPGTQSYAWPSEAVPLLLLALALRRGGWRNAVADARRFSGVYALAALCLFFLVLPLSQASRGLTTVSLGSCDAADYAGGARVLMEFARSDREGFVGLTEVVRVHSVDNFADYWLRLNHFTPAALIALNGTILDCAPHELTSLLTMLVLAGSLPVVFWTARAVVGLRRGAATWVALFYGLSPVTWYAVAHVSPGQLLAAQAIALVTWAGMAMWPRLARGAWSGGFAFAGVLLVAYWLILGSYNFIVLVCLVPAVAFAGGLALRQGRWDRFARWSVCMLTPLALSAVLFAPRVLGLAERFTLLRTYDFGWRIPPLSPEGWLAFTGHAPTLLPMPTLARGLLSLFVVTLVVAAVWRRRLLAWRCACVALPALAGYAYLQWRGATLGTNASYDAYKLLAVFFPGVLAASVAWLSWLARPGRMRLLGGGLCVLVALAHAIALSQSFRALSAAPLRVTLELRDVRKVEAMPDVASVNLLVPDMWSRLWANALLLRTPHYFPTHTYEARLNTPLRGEWDLEGGRIARMLPGDGRRALSPRFALVDTRAPTYFRASLGHGWHDEEHDVGAGERWQWTQREATLSVENPHAAPLTITCTIDGRSAADRHVSLSVAESGAVMPAVAMNDARARTTFPPLTIPPGRSTLVLRSVEPATVVSAADPRVLAVCVFRLEMAVVE